MLDFDFLSEVLIGCVANSLDIGRKHKLANLLHLKFWTPGDLSAPMQLETLSEQLNYKVREIFSPRSPQQRESHRMCSTCASQHEGNAMCHKPCTDSQRCPL